MESPNLEYRVIASKPTHETLQIALNRSAKQGYRVVATTASDVIMERLAVADERTLPPISASALGGANN